MKTRPLGKTGNDLPVLSFGAFSLGAEFRSITLDEAMLSTKTAIDLGMNFIDTSPYYGRGMSEIVAKNVTGNLLDRHMKPLFL